jgi:MoxR-like ATPase
MTIDETILKDFETNHVALRQIRDSLSNIIVGQKDVIDLVLVTLLSNGHGLLVGMPGLAKTLLVKTIGQAFQFDTKRVQCTPDLMPNDILGSEVLEQSQDGTRHFRFIKGPVFSQLFMADEINRASPKTQSALLQAMEERTVTIAGKTHSLPEPFHVLATQNPVEQEGTYLLPEAQLDRFLLQINVGYPDMQAEKVIMSQKRAPIQHQTTPETLLKLQNFVHKIPVGEKLSDVILHLVRMCRPNQDGALDRINNSVEWGPSPRAAQALNIAVRARALLNGRPAPSLDDVESLMIPALIHRMSLKYTAVMQGQTKEALIHHAFEQAQYLVES